MYTSDEFRADIRTAELSVAKIRRGVRADDILDLFRLLDRLSTGYGTLGKTGIDLRAEMTRVETVHNTLIDKAEIAVRAMRKQGGLADARAKVEPPESCWWWYLDQRVAAQRSKQARRLLRGLAVGAVLLAVLTVVYVLFLRPDEATRLRYGYTFDAEAQVEQGDYAAALEFYQKALAIAPDDPEINLMIGVMYEALQRSGDAAEYYADAEMLYGTREMFLSMRSRQYNLLGWYDEGAADAQAAIELDDQFALAYCALSSAHEGQGRVPDAITALQMCADLAREQGQDQLYVIAASRLAMLLQMPIEVNTTPSDKQSSE